MLVTSRVMDTLKGIGLNLYERKLWIALLARGNATAGELAEIAGVPRSRTYDTLESLAEKGFVIIQTGKPIRYVAPHPSEALERVKRKLEQDIRMVQKKIDDLKTSPMMGELVKLYETGLKLISPGEMTGAIRGRHSVFQHLNMMIGDATQKVSMITSPERLAELMSSSFDALKKARQRGVDIRIAVPLTDRHADVIRMLGAVADVRGIDEKEVTLTGQFCVVDGTQLLFSLTDPKKVDASQELAFWSKSDHAAGEVFEPLFELVWSHSKQAA